LRDCFPPDIRRALEELPETLDATYERTLLGIGNAKREYAYRLFQCLAVSIRPLRVEELAEVLAIRLDTGEDSEYHSDWRPEDARQAVLTACSSLITIVNVDGSPVVQFSHFSVKEFLMSSRLANAGEHLSFYHILPHSAHTVLARACLSILLNLGDQVDKSAVENIHSQSTRLGTGLTMANLKAYRRASRILWNVCLTQTGPTLRHGSGYMTLIVLGKDPWRRCTDATRGQAIILCGTVWFPQPHGTPHHNPSDGC
jgi:hypothetical protein